MAAAFCKMQNSPIDKAMYIPRFLRTGTAGLQFSGH